MSNGMDWLSQAASVDTYAASAAMCKQLRCRADPKPTGWCSRQKKPHGRKSGDDPNGKLRH